MTEPTGGVAASIRVDKWLYFARFFKTRTLAAKTVTAGHLRVNGTRVTKASATVGAGDVLTFPQGKRIRVVRLLAVGIRRGPAPEAQALYDDLTPVSEPPASAPGADRVGGRPTKKARRDMLKQEYPSDLE